MSKRAVEKKLKAKAQAREQAKEKKEQNELTRFVELLSKLNNEAMEMLETGDLSGLYSMNDTVEGLFSIQHDNQDELYTGIDHEAKTIYGNFNALVQLTEKVGEQEWSEENSDHARKSLENILRASIVIVKKYGLFD